MKAKKILVVLCILLLVASTGVCGYFTYKYFDLKDEYSIKEIQLTDVIKTTYYRGEEINFLEARLKVKYSNGESETMSLEQDMVEDFSTTTAGDRTLNIKYKSKSCSVNYHVIDFHIGKYYHTKTITVNDETEQIEGVETWTVAESKWYVQFNADGTGKEMTRANAELPFTLFETFTWEFDPVGGVIYLGGDKEHGTTVDDDTFYIGYGEGFTLEK